MIGKRNFSFLILIMMLLVINVAQAAPETASTLPIGIISPEFSYGIVDGLAEKFDAGGALISVTDPYHLELTGPKVAKLSPAAGTLINVLNSWEPGLGDKLTFPSVDFKANPTIDYFVINPAYGVKENLAVGFAVPFIHYQNQMSVTASGVTNVEQIRQYVKNIDPTMDKYFSQIADQSGNIPGAVQDILRAKGYKPITMSEFRTVGDMQIYARYRYFENENFRLAIRPYLLLPTGRDDDPDDLGDYAVGGLFGIGTYLTQEWTALPWWRISLILQYQAHLPDRVERRVPASNEDVLPGIDRKENVARQEGNIFDVTISNRFRLNRLLDVGAFYGLTAKDPDWYSGNRGYDYSLLARDTGYQSQRFGAFFELITADLYFEKKLPLPFILGYTFSSTIAAVNSPNQSTHVLNMRMFF